MASPAPPPPVLISGTSLHSLLTHKSLIAHLQATLPSFTPSIHSPIRHAHRTTTPTSSLLLMPSWSTSPSLPYIGTKLVTHHPNNSALNLPGVQAVYVLFDSLTGQPLAYIDATHLTLFRTSCVSALASSYLSRQDSNTLTMIGSGSLAPHLIKAHLAVRPRVKRVIIWNRTIEKAKSLADQLTQENAHQDVSFESNECLEEAVRLGDVISCATNSQVPLVKGVDLKKGAHLDLVGSFVPAMRECDDEAMVKGRVYVDNEMAMVEAGELVGGFERGVIKKEDVRGDLVELVKGEKAGRGSMAEITVFKSVGSGVVDMLSAAMVYEKYVEKNSVG